MLMLCGYSCYYVCCCCYDEFDEVGYIDDSDCDEVCLFFCICFNKQFGNCIEIWLVVFYCCNVQEFCNGGLCLLREGVLFFNFWFVEVFINSCSGDCQCFLVFVSESG